MTTEIENENQTTPLLGQSQNPSYASKYKNHLVVITMIQSLFTTGVIYGWPSLVLILSDEGMYKEMCGEEYENEVSYHTTSITLYLLNHLELVRHKF